MDACDTLFDFQCFVQNHVGSNLLTLNTEGNDTNVLITFWNDTNSLLNTDQSRTNFDYTTPTWDRVYRIYLTMFASDTNQELIKIYSQKLIYALTQNKCLYQAVVPSGKEYISNLQANRQISEIDFTIEKQRPTSPNYITADALIAFTIFSTQYKVS
jgi:hypothetical protein